MVDLYKAYKEHIADPNDNQLFQGMASVIGQYTSEKGLMREADFEHFNNPDFLSILNASPGITAIVNFQTKGYLFLSENTHAMLGYSTEDFYKQGIAKSLAIFPPSHTEIIMGKIFPIMFEYFEKYEGSADLYNLRISYNTKIIRQDGTTGWYLHQIKVLDTDKNNKVHMGFKMITDISDFKKDESVNMVVSKKNELGVYTNIFAQNFICDSPKYVISNREKEVLLLLGNGKGSKEIADSLSISEHTVSSHRKNLMKKMEAKSSGELLKKAISNGII